MSIGIIFLWILRIFNPQYSLEEVLDFKAKEELLQLYWFIAMPLFYIDNNRRRCSTESYRAFMWTEFENLTMSNYAYDYESNARTAGGMKTIVIQNGRIEV